jgi:predicted thioredoxin/glutaredoxin
VSEYDIDEDNLLQRRFTDRVPVILYRGRVLAEGRVDPNQLRAALDGIAEGKPVAADDSVTGADSAADRG